MKPIRNRTDLNRALKQLVAADPRLAHAATAVAPLPLRLATPGLPGLLRIVAGQQLSKESAAAVWSRVEETFEPLSAETLIAASDETLRGAGLSRQKMKTFRAVAEAVAAGLDLEGLAKGPPEAAHEALVALPGIGQWSADLYLMFCAGHPDILPVGDLAVRRGAARVLSLEDDIAPAALAELGTIWSPWRSTAARLFWAAYRLPSDRLVNPQPATL